MFCGGVFLFYFIFLTPRLSEQKSSWFKVMSYLVASFPENAGGFSSLPLRLIDLSFFLICFPFISGCERKLFQKLDVLFFKLKERVQTLAQVET